MSLRRALLLCPFLLLLGACAQQRVILLPEPDGTVGAVEIKSASGQQRIDTAYGGIDVSRGGSLDTFKTSQSRVDRDYKPLLAARPPRPVTFVVHFEFGSPTHVTPDSKAIVQQILHVLSERPAPELIVIGHTDTMGTDAYNDRLSLERARGVVAFLRRHGVTAKRVEAIGRGKRDQAVKTRNSVASKANRRVEITIR